jgi:Ca2+-binding RTX toxin-like protein
MSTISLTSTEYAMLFDLIDAGEIRNVSGLGNNVANPLWGNADQPFIRLAPENYAGVNSPTGVEVDINGLPVDTNPGAPGVQVNQTLPNERLISDVLSAQVQPLDSNGDPTNSMPNPFGTNLNLMLFGQFFDHGLDFLKRGGGTYTIDLSELPPDIAADDFLLENLPPGFPPAMFQGRGARYIDNGDGTYTLDNANGTLHINKTSPFVDQNQTYGSTIEISYLLRESIFDENGVVIGKGAKLLDGPADASGTGTLARYQDILTNNGVSQDDIDTALDMAASGSDYDAWLFLSSRSGFVNFGDVGDANHTPILGDKNDFNASPVDQTGAPNANFSLSALLSYYIAGDHRANENVGLTAIHTVWHREHNYQVEQISSAHPEWTAEQVYQAAKMIVEAEYQRVVFDEFSSAMSGDLSGEHGFSGYDPNVNPTISEEFASAVYRVGHSMINETLAYVDADGNHQEISLIGAFLNPDLFASNLGGMGSTEALLLGGSQVAHQQIDELLVNAVRNMLLGIPQDLGAMNISRGREVGLASLNELRAIIANGTLVEQAGQASDYNTTSAADEGLTIQAYTGWSDFGANLRDPDMLVDFIALYGIDPTLEAATNFADKLAAATVLMSNAAFMNSTETGLNDVDIWIGGLAERAFGNSQMGSTFTWVFQEQLDRLQDGDRFYYIERFEGTALLEQLQAQRFSDIVARNTGLEHLHDDIFAVAHEVSLTDDGNADSNADTADFSGVSAAEVETDKLIIVGNDNANNIVGSVGDDTIYGEDGADLIQGGAGDDGIKGGEGADQLDGNSGDDRIFGDAGDDSIVGGSGSDILLGGDGNDVLSGGTGQDRLFGGTGDDVMISGSGEDRFDGGDGMDTADYSASSAGVTVNLGIEGFNGIGGDAEDDRWFNVERVIGSAFADSLTGDGLANVLEGGGGSDMLAGGGGDDVLDGGTGADNMSGGSGNDTYVVDQVGDTVSDTGGGTDTVRSYISYTAGANIENVKLLGAAAINATGNAGINVLTGNNAANVLSGLGNNDFLYGLAGGDTLDGGTGADYMEGGKGNDTYVVDDVGDDVVETYSNAEGGGVDKVKSSISYVAGANIDDVTLTGAGNINATGNELANVLVGNSGLNILNGLGGNDSYYVQNAGDVVVEGPGGGTDKVYSTVDYALGAGVEVESLIAASGAGLTLTGNAFSHVITGGAGGDTLNGGSGNDKLDGLGGADTMSGGNGNDTYQVDAAGDVVVETAGQGTDIVYASVSYALGAAAQVEKLYASSDAGISLTGNAYSHTIRGAAGDDSLTGGGGNDSLDGRGGSDTMAGGGGNDTYYVDNSGDVIAEGAAGGTDTVRAASDFVLGAGVHVERLYAAGTADAVSLTGNEFSHMIQGAGGDDTLTGGTGNDTLDGNAGADTMAGGIGDDIMIVDNAGDVIVEAAGEGTDTVQASVDYTLTTGASVEKMYATSAGGVALTGNELVNQLFGSTGNDTLDGAGGTDRLKGGAGNDTFVFKSVSETGNTTGTADRIMDFAPGDKIDLTGMELETGLSFDFVGAASFSGLHGELRFAAAGANTIVSGDINGDAVSDFKIILIGNHVLTGGDFIL